MSDLDIPVSGGTATPICWDMGTAEPDAVGQGTWATLLAVSPSMLYGLYFGNEGTLTDGDNFSFNFRCPAGTYTLRFNASIEVNRAIIDVYIDGSEEGSFDLVGATNNLNIETIAGLVLTEGEHVLKFQIDGKSGTHFFFTTQGISLQRTV